VHQGYTCCHIGFSLTIVESTANNRRGLRNNPSSKSCLHSEIAEASVIQAFFSPLKQKLAESMWVDQSPEFPRTRQLRCQSRLQTPTSVSAIDCIQFNSEAFRAISRLPEFRLSWVPLSISRQPCIPRQFPIKPDTRQRDISQAIAAKNDREMRP
jgi:hypothetical protein